MADRSAASLRRDHPRQECDAETCANQFDHELDLAAASDHVRLEPAAAASLEDHAVQSKTALEEDKGRRLDVGERHRKPFCQGMSRRKQRHEGFAPNHLPVEIVGRGKQGPCKLDLTSPKALLESVAAMLAQPDLDPGIALPIDGEERSEQGAASNRRQPQPQYAALESSDLIELREQIVAVSEQFHSATIDDLSSGCQRASMTDPVQQRHADFILQLLHRFADRGLGGEHRLGSLGKAALADDLNKSAKRSEFHLLVHIRILSSQSIHFHHAALQHTFQGAETAENESDDDTSQDDQVCSPQFRVAGGDRGCLLARGRGDCPRVCATASRINRGTRFAPPAPGYPAVERPKRAARRKMVPRRHAVVLRASCARCARPSRVPGAYGSQSAVRHSDQHDRRHAGDGVHYRSLLSLEGGT